MFLQSEEYDFLRQDSRLGPRIILLGYGGSHAYGTNIATSDVDVRGCALNSKEEILLGEDFEQVVHEGTDTTVYSFRKLMTLLAGCNPNTIELLGLEPDQYLYVSPVGRELLDHKKIFLSKRAIHTFGGYANQQLRRLDNKAARLVGQAEREQHILNSIQNAAYDFKNRYFPPQGDDAIRLYLDDAIQEGVEKEIFMDVHLTHYPLRDYKFMWNEMSNIVKEYGKVGMRNSKAIEHGKLAKHMMHLVRLYYMCFDILERGEIVTRRRAEHELLMEIRQGKFLDSNRQPTPEFFEFLNELDARFEYAKKHTELPEEPDLAAIREFVASVNERVVKDEI